MTENGVESVADEVDGEDADGEPASPFSVLSEPDGGQAARSADDRHERDRPVADLLKLDSRFRLESPDWFEESSGEGQREHRNEANQCARSEEDDEQGRSDGSMPLAHGGGCYPRPGEEATSIDVAENG